MAPYLELGLCCTCLALCFLWRKGEKVAQTVLITGGAKGIGKEISIQLAKEGFQVVIDYYHSEQAAHEIQKMLQEQNLLVDIFKADVSKREQVKKLTDFAIQKYGKIDILINNAGIDEMKLFTEISDEDWDNMINTNLYSAFCVTQEVTKEMIKNKRGCIINISSIWGLVGASCETHYAISKAGMDAMTKSLAKELGPSGIRVNSIAPGFIDTSMNEKLEEQDKKQIIGETPLGKIGTPKDIVRGVKWLIEDDFTTGQIISINGGWIIT